MYSMSPYSGELISDEACMKKYNHDHHRRLMVSLDLGERAHERISSGQAITQFAIDLAKYIDMKRYGEPIVVHFGAEPKVMGYSLIQLIETSQISGHFAEDTDRAFIDVFSCKAFLPERTAEFCKEYFGAKKMQYSISFRDI